MNNLSTQIATTCEQSERLLAMGVKPETADMCYNTYHDKTDGKVKADVNHAGARLYQDAMYIPSWSLSRLISMMPTSVPDPKLGYEAHHPELIKNESGYTLSVRRYTADCLVGTHIENDPIECCVSMIDWLIKNNHFNKEYLK